MLNGVKNLNIADEIKLNSIKQRSKYNLTVKCPDAENANLLEQKLKSTFPTNISVKRIQTSLPEVKIVRIITTLNGNDLFRVFLAQNQWIKPEQVQLKVFYQVNIRGFSYYNMVLACNHTLLNDILSRKFIIINLREYRVFENIRLIQCNKCHGYGHISNNCKNPEYCKFCLESHRSATCTNRDSPPKCVNCKVANQKGANFNNNHLSTNENCPVRKERIKQLKLYASKN